MRKCECLDGEGIDDVVSGECRTNLRFNSELCESLARLSGGDDDLLVFRLLAGEADSALGSDADLDCCNLVGGNDDRAALVVGEAQRLPLRQAGLDSCRGVRRCAIDRVGQLAGAVGDDDADINSADRFGC